MPAPSRPGARRSHSQKAQGPTSVQTHWFLNKLVIGLLLAVAVIGVFLPAVHNGFVNYDDPVFLYENSHVASGLNLENIRWAFANSQAGFWYPVTWLSHLLDFSLFGINAGGHHFTSILLHALNTTLLFLVLGRATGKTWPSAFVAALFGLHPLHVEPVAWAADRKDVLSATFWMLTLWAYIRYGEQSRIESLRPIRSRWYWLALFFFTLGLMSKTMLVTLPFVLLALDWWPLGRFRSMSTTANDFNTTQSAKFRRAAMEKLPFLALALPAIWLTLHGQSAIGALPNAAEITFTHRIANANLSCVRYIQQTIWPSNLAVHYPFPSSFSVAAVTGCALLLLIITLAAAVCAKAHPYVSFGWIWYIISLLPVIGLVQIAGHAHADRYAYVPTIGLYLIIAWSATRLVVGHRWRAAACGIAATTVIVSCATLTRQQISFWKDSEALFRHSLSIIPDDEMAHNNLGSALAEKGDLDGAINHWMEALRLFPDFAEAHCNLGSVLARKGQLPEAIIHLEEGVRLNPNNPNARFDLATAFLKSGRPDEAIAQYQQCLNLAPDNAPAYLALAHALLAKGRVNEAILTLDTSLRLKEDSAEAQNELGMAFGMQGRSDEASAHLRKALQLDPNYAEAHCNLGIVLVNQNNLDEAISHLQFALAKNPAYPEAHCNLGVALGKQERWDDAVAHLREALRLRPDYRDAQNNLQAVLALKQQSGK
jgi:tetratricopeptide (TPR) repeat protein